MKHNSFSKTFTTDQSPKKVFTAFNNVRQWWSGLYEETITGNTDKLNDEFTFVAGGGAHYSKQKLVELVPGKKVVWRIIESNLSFLEKTDEWTGTHIIFEISGKGNKTQFVFTHEGLTAESECYDSCAPAWSQYLLTKFLPLVQARELVQQ